MTTDGRREQARCRVMVVDDSAVIRGLVTRSLEEDPDIAVVASVANGEMAVKALGRNRVDVVILDIEMPVMDGLTALPLLLRAQPGVKVIMASTLTRRNADVSLRALQAGATDYVTKPTAAEGVGAAAAFREELRSKVKALAGLEGTARTSVRPAPVRATPGSGAAAAPAAATGTAPRPLVPPPGRSIHLRPAGSTPPQVLAIGSSTGGPQALFKVMGDLRGSLAHLPVLITQHMPATFTTLLAEHLGRVSGLNCAEAVDGERLLPGRVYVAPGGWHMTVRREEAGTLLRLNQDPPENFCRPSVDPMLRSLSAIYGSRLLVLMLTGMGSDGLKGSRVAVEAGATVVAQDEASSVVWGMPGAVALDGLCSAVLPLDQIGAHLAKRLMRNAA